MTTQVFRGSSNKEVISQIRDTFGEDISVLSSKTFKDPAGKGNFVEITVEINQPSGPASAVDVTQRLRTAGVSPQLLARIQRLLKGANPSLGSNEALAEVINKEFTLGSRRANERRIVAFVGPTGVGKTTTICKLASQRHKEKVAVISIDNFKFGGAEQLQRLARELGVDFLTARCSNSLSRALGNFSHKDRIYIDSAGSGPWDQSLLAELGTILDCAYPVEKLLLLPASGNIPDLKATLGAFQNLGIESLGITKTDETTHFGPCLSVLFEAQMRVEIFGTGQVIHRDLEEANAHRIVKTLLQTVH